MIFNRECRVPYGARRRPVAALAQAVRPPGLAREIDRFTAVPPRQGSAITSASSFTGAYLILRIRTATGFDLLSRSMSAEHPQLPAVGVFPPALAVAPSPVVRALQSSLCARHLLVCPALAMAPISALVRVDEQLHFPETARGHAPGAGVQASGTAQ